MGFREGSGVLGGPSWGLPWLPRSGFLDRNPNSLFGAVSAPPDPPEGLPPRPPPGTPQELRGRYRMRSVRGGFGCESASFPGAGAETEMLRSSLNFQKNSHDSEIWLRSLLFCGSRAGARNGSAFY